MLNLRNQMAWKSSTQGYPQHEQYSKTQSFFQIQAKQQTLKAADDPQLFLEKIQRVRDKIRTLTLRDIQTIKKITGVKQINYEDIVFLKRVVREVLLAKDQQNIQMLLCFSLHNTLQGLLLLLKQVTDSPFVVSTLVLNQSTGEILDEQVSAFDFNHLAAKSEQDMHKTVLFTISIKDAGTIILDLFQKSQQNVG